MPGQFGLNAGILPSPGFTYVNMEINYSTSTLNDTKGNALPGNANLNLWVIENIYFYVPNTKVLGGNLGFSDLKRKLLRYIRQYNKSPRTVKWKYADPSRHISTQSVGTGH